MILPRAAYCAMAACLAVFAVPVSADVMEIGDSGDAVWVAGGESTIQTREQLRKKRAAMSASLAEATGDTPVPPEAIVQLGGTARGIPKAYVGKVYELSQRYDLSPALIEALVWQESRWRERAVSPAGARGLAQLMPATARYLGVDPDDPMQNLEGGARYLREQLNRFDGNLHLALAAYNAGPGRVIKAGGIPRIRETQNYVASIMGRDRKSVV